MKRERRQSTSWGASRLGAIVALLSCASLTVHGCSIEYHSNREASPEDALRAKWRFGKSVAKRIRDHIIAQPKIIAETCSGVRAYLGGAAAPGALNMNLLNSSTENFVLHALNTLDPLGDDAAAVRSACQSSKPGAECADQVILLARSLEQSAATLKRDQLAAAKFAFAWSREIGEAIPSSTGLSRVQLISNIDLSGAAVIGAVHAAAWLDQQASSIASNISWGQGALKMALSFAAGLILSEVALVITAELEREGLVHYAHIAQTACQLYERADSRPIVTSQLLRKLILRTQSPERIASVAGPRLAEVCSDLPESTPGAADGCRSMANQWGLNTNDDADGRGTVPDAKGDGVRRKATPRPARAGGSGEWSISPLALLASPPTPPQQPTAEMFVDPVEEEACELDEQFRAECYDVRAATAVKTSTDSSRKLAEDLLKAVEEGCPSAELSNCEMKNIVVRASVRLAVGVAVDTRGLSSLTAELTALHREMRDRLDFAHRYRRELDALEAALRREFENSTTPLITFARGTRGFLVRIDSVYAVARNTLSDESRMRAGLSHLARFLREHRGVKAHVVGYADSKAPSKLTVDIYAGKDKSRKTAALYDNRGLAAMRAHLISAILSEICGDCESQVAAVGSGTNQGRFVEIVLSIGDSLMDVE